MWRMNVIPKHIATAGHCCMQFVTDFVFGMVILKIILSNTSSLSNYLQGKQLDVSTARKTADCTIQTLWDCRSEDHFENARQIALKLSDSIKEQIQETRFASEESCVPSYPNFSGWNKWKRKSTRPAQTAQDHYRVTSYYTSIDKAVAEMRSRFDSKDQTILCALGDIVLYRDTSDESHHVIASKYNIDE
jgi:hypothetical protein